jgi:4-hydroxybenzoate polyprenyltransferase
MGFLLFLRPWFWLPAIGVGLSGFLFAGVSTISPIRLFFLLLTIGPGLAAFAETFNDICDETRDNASKQHRLWRISLAGGSGMLSRKVISHIQAYSVCGITFSISIIGALCLGQIATVLVILGLLSAILYSISPFRGKDNTIIGQFFLAVGYGPIAFHIGFFASGATAIDLRAVFVSVLIGIWVVIVGITADVLDIDDSTKLGEKNLAVVIGRRPALLLSSIGSILILILTTSIAYLNIFSFRYFFYSITVCASLLRSLILLRRDPDTLLLMKMHMMAIILEASFPLSLRPL